jgi:hypothetical protein
VITGARAITALAALTLAACSRALPAPPLGAHDEAETFSVVPYPPPPGRVEIIHPASPGMKKPVWIDGEWLWKGQRWVWKPGEWAVPPAGQRYAPPATVFLGDGSIVHYAGAWRPDRPHPPTPSP